MWSARCGVWCWKRVGVGVGGCGRGSRIEVVVVGSGEHSASAARLSAAPVARTSQQPTAPILITPIFHVGGSFVACGWGGACDLNRSLYSKFTCRLHVGGTDGGTLPFVLYL